MLARPLFRKQQRLNLVCGLAQARATLADHLTEATTLAQARSALAQATTLTQTCAALAEARAALAQTRAALAETHVALRGNFAAHTRAGGRRGDNSFLGGLHVADQRLFFEAHFSSSR